MPPVFIVWSQMLDDTAQSTQEITPTLIRLATCNISFHFRPCFDDASSATATVKRSHNWAGVTLFL